MTMSSSDINSMTVAALKDALKERGLPTSGKKADLVKRLQDSGNVDDAAGNKDADAVTDAKETASGADTAAPQAAVGPSEDQPVTDAREGEDDPVAKRIQRFGSSVLAEDEKAKLREARFKASNPATDPTKLEQRAARFGILTEEARKKKETERAKRFQLDTPELLAEKKRAREERFKQPVAETKQVPLDQLAALIQKRS